MNARIHQILGDVALFVEVAKAKSIKRAAEELGIPDSTLSRRITELEKSLGVQLLHRTTRRIELTEPGELYFAQCRDIVDAAEVANARLKDLTGAPQGQIRLSLPVDFSLLFVAPLIAEFATVFPRVTFDVRLGENWDDLLDNGLDIAIRLGQQSDSALTVRHLGEVHYGLYAAPHYLRRRGTPAHPSELAGHDCIRMVCPHWSPQWTLRQGKHKQRVEVPFRIEVNNIGLVRRFATLGVGIAPIDSILAREDISTGLLHRVLPDWHFEPVPIFALTSSRVMPEKTRAFLQFLANRIRDTMGQITTPVEVT